jgi:hypothetical protein
MGHISHLSNRFQHGDFAEVLDVDVDGSAYAGACDFSPLLLSCCPMPLSFASDGAIRRSSHSGRMTGKREAIPT